MLITNKEVIQSYIITAARYDFNVYEKRILFRLVEMCQEQLEGREIGRDFKLDKTLFGDYVVSMPITAFLNGEDDENYTRVKSALRGLRNKTIEYEDNKIWKLIGIIEKPVLEKRGVVYFELQPEIFDAILNFAQGYRKYELKTAFSFESAYSMRFYELLSGKEGKIIPYGIEKLKLMFQVQKKYKQINDFLKRVVEPARKELDVKSPISFTYKYDKVGKKITGLTFFPYKTKNSDENLEQKKLEKQTSLDWDLDRMTINYLKQNYMFDTDEIKHNRDVFVEAEKKLDIMGIMASKKRYCEGRKNPKGTLINILKGELENLKNKEQTTPEQNQQARNINSIAESMANKFKG